MGTVRIAERIAAKDDIAALLTPAILKKYDVAKPIGIEGANTNAPVFETSDGKIVTFLDDAGGFMSAKNQMRRNVDSLPTVYGAEKVDDIQNRVVWAITMEKLTPLSASEREQFSPSAAEYWLYEYPGVETEGLTSEEMENPWEVWQTNPNHRMFESLTDLQRASVDLEARASRDDVWQIDPHEDNVMWGSNGKLKYVDFGSIQFPNSQFKV